MRFIKSILLFCLCSLSLYAFAEKVCQINVNYPAMNNCLFLLNAETCHTKGLELEHMTQSAYTCEWQQMLWKSCEIVSTGKNDKIECSQVALEDCAKFEYCILRGHD